MTYLPTPDYERAKPLLAVRVHGAFQAWEGRRIGSSGKHLIISAFREQPNPPCITRLLHKDAHALPLGGELERVKYAIGYLVVTCTQYC